MVQDARKSVKFAPSMEANFTRSPKKIPQKAAGSLLLFLALLFLITLAESCANIIPPLGGPKDTLPPVPVLLQPKDSTLNFKGNRIVFTFNEYVNLDQIQENLLVSPTPKINPTVEARLRTVSVRIRDTLEPNTTYTLNFGKAIRDVNENNPLTNFTYTFSTGSYIDSLELIGNVILAQTGKHDSTMIVLLHRNLDDSAVVKERPRYYTKVDSAGNFHFHNLAPGTYNLFALKNEGVPQYGDPTQLFAFYGQTLVLNDQRPAPIQLYAYAEPAPPTPPKKQAATAPNRRKEKEEEQDRRLRFGLNLENSTLDVLKNLVLNFPDSLKRFDSSKLILTDEQFKPLSYRLEVDSTGKLYSLFYNWPIDQGFKLIAQEGMAEDSLGKSILKTDTVSFRTMKDSDYGSIRFRFPNIDTSQHPVLQLVQNDKVAYSYPIPGKELRIARFRPAEFEIRILFDENQNGKWDYGSFFGEKRQPEKVKSVGKKVTIKANWDNEIDITL